MLGRHGLRGNKNLNDKSDTIEVNKDRIIKSLSRENTFKKNKSLPWFSILLIIIYVLVYLFCVYGTESVLYIDFSSLGLFRVSTGNEILSGKFLALIFNVFVHRSVWDLTNTIFIIIFCGFFIEKYVKRKVILICYVISMALFNVISLFLYPEVLYCGSFTIVSFLIGMCIYFSYRFKRFIVSIDVYIYVALTFIGFFISYMVYFYNIFQFALSYLIGVFVTFILDTKVLRQ